jgi:ADP-L-glycero-D-manno-heptose 6-epimerase
MGTGRIIVTGGAGFIGSHLVEALNRRGRTDILVVDQLGRDEKWRNLIGLQVADVLQRDAFRAALHEDRVPPAEAVFHFGACSATTEADTGYLLDNNYRYSMDVCAWCLRHETRFIYASSAATYGDGAQGYADTDAVTPTLRPLTPYGFSKHLFDLWALRQGHLRTIVGLKFFNVYGPREAHKGDMRSLVHKAVEQLRATGELCLFKSHRPEYRDGEQVRDFVWVGDAVQSRSSSWSARSWPACSTVARGRGTLGSTSPGRSAGPWGGSRGSASSTCRRNSVPGISITRWRISGNSGRRVTGPPSRPWRTAYTPVSTPA